MTREYEHSKCEKCGAEAFGDNLCTACYLTRFDKVVDGGVEYKWNSKENRYEADD